jgi:hypothetical protein
VVVRDGDESGDIVLRVVEEHSGRSMPTTPVDTIVDQHSRAAPLEHDALVATELPASGETRRENGRDLLDR